MAEQTQQGMGDRIVNIIACVITAVWAVSFVADIFVKDYEPSAYIHVIMMTVAGAAFGKTIVLRNGKNGNGNGNGNGANK